MYRSRNWGCRLLTDLTIHGYQALILENASLRVCLLAEKGSDIVELLYKPADLNLLALTPNGLRRRGETASVASRMGNFFDNYEGGWQEICPSAGPPCDYRSAELGQHGEVALLPWSWQVLEDRPEQVAVRLTVDGLRMPFRLEKVLRLRGEAAALEIEERVVNLSPLPLELMWGHHPAFGHPFIGRGAAIALPPCRILVPPSEIFPEQRLPPGFQGEWPLAKDRAGKAVDLSQIPGPENRTADFFFLTDLEQARYEITSPEGALSLVVEWERQVMPALWFWQVCGGVPDWPWWGRLYVQALEPFSSPDWSLAEAVRQGRHLRLDRGQDLSFYMRAAVSRRGGSLK